MKLELLIKALVIFHKYDHTAICNIEKGYFFIEGQNNEIFYPDKMDKRDVNTLKRLHWHFQKNVPGERNWKTL